MRLRLTVRRNGVPEVKLMWNVEADTDFTISRLLANVNDVVPLESADWGLEDYAVEYRDGEDGFECLHFQLVRDILKEDDQVLIRPLLTNDLRRRLLSARHQVTADGRRLVDGVTFGRPWLGTPANRPGIELPPRKRARISYRPNNGDGNIDGLATDSSTPTSQDEDYSYASPVGTCEDEPLLLEGLKDKGEGRGTVVGEGYVKNGASHVDDSTLAADDTVRPVTLHENSPPLPAYPGETELSLAEHPQTLSSILSKLKGENASSPATGNEKDAVRKSSNSVSSNDTSTESSSDASSSEDSDSTSNSGTDSDASSDSGSSDSEDGAGVPLGPAKRKPAGHSAPKSDFASTSSPSEEDVKGRASRPVADDASSDSDDPEDSSDESDSSSESSDDMNLKNRTAAPHLSRVNVQKTKTKSDQTAPMPAPKVISQEPKPMAAGETPRLTRTQKRNQRKRQAKQHQAERKAADDPTRGEGGAPPQDDELVKRRQALLESLEAGAGAVVTPRKRKAQDEEVESKSTVQNVSTLPSAKTQRSTTSQRGMRFDFSAPGRLLFGALGFGGSKDKEEEKQMLDARTNDHGDVRKEDEAEAPEDPDAWRDKITYRAVECAREGVELSEPPFPFVQRWDPQQRADVWFGNNKRGGKGKRKQRNQSHYYEEDSGGGKRKTSPWPELLEYDEDTNMDGHPVDENIPGECDAEEPYDAPEDLPTLPNNIKTLPPLARGEAAPGMVITWKQWLLSKATNWQPQFGNVTAVVLRVDEADVDALHVLLAKRDRNLDRNEKEYDPQTGQRIYGGFEAPDLDEEEGEESENDDGSRLVTFSEMTDPRVVQSQAACGSFSTDLPGDDSEIPDSRPQDGQGDTNFEPFSMELQVPLSTDPAVPNGGSDAEHPPPSDAADGGPPKNASLDVPSAVSSVASGRRQPDPNSLPVSLEFDMTIPDSAAESQVNGTKGQEGDGNRKNRGPSVQKGSGDTNNHLSANEAHHVKIIESPSSVPDVLPEEIKPAGEDQSFFEVEDEYLPKNLRREASGLAAVKKEAGREREEAERIDLKREGSLPRLIFPDSSPPPRFGSQKQEQGGKKSRKRRRRERTSPFEVPAGSQVIDLLSEGNSEVGAPVGTPISNQKQRNGTPRGSQSGTPRASQKQTETPASQRKKATPASQKKASQKGDSLLKGPGWAKKKKGWEAGATV